MSVVPAVAGRSTPLRATMYAVTPTLSVEASQARLTEVDATLVVCRFCGTDGASPSPAAGVVTASAVLSAEKFGTASRARTWYEYAVFAATVVSVKVFVDGTADQDAVPVAPRTSGLPTLSLELFQVRTTWFTFTVGACRLRRHRRWR